MRLDERQAKEIDQAFRTQGWDVEAHRSPIGSWGWELRLKPVEGKNGGTPYYAFELRDVRMLVSAGVVQRIEES